MLATFLDPWNKPEEDAIYSPPCWYLRLPRFWSCEPANEGEAIGVAQPTETKRSAQYLICSVRIEAWSRSHRGYRRMTHSRPQARNFEAGSMLSLCHFRVQEVVRSWSSDNVDPESSSVRFGETCKVKLTSIDFLTSSNYVYCFQSGCDTVTWPSCNNTSW